MFKEANNNFEDYFDIVQCIHKSAKEELGEDSFFCASNGDSSIISVYDGCGGLGSKKYETYKDHTGAYIASRIVSGAVADWYYRYANRYWNNANEIVESIESYIKKAYAVGDEYAIENSRIRGSMVRKFPTTMAMAFAQVIKSEVIVHILWAGDSRVYMLDDNGLAQLTIDDVDVKDAFENLSKDGAMTNVLSADGNFKIHSKSIVLKKPAMVMSATDGCFGYFSSPMEFEYQILRNMLGSQTPVGFTNNLSNCIKEVTGDDMAMGLMSFYFGDYKKTIEKFKPRLNYMSQMFVAAMEEDNTNENLRRIWMEYKPNYERYWNI